jgi:hypothetical protein
MGARRIGAGADLARAPPRTGPDRGTSSREKRK